MKIEVFQFSPNRPGSSTWGSGDFLSLLGWLGGQFHSDLGKTCQFFWQHYTTRRHVYSTQRLWIHQRTGRQVQLGQAWSRPSLLDVLFSNWRLLCCIIMAVILTSMNSYELVFWGQKWQHARNTPHQQRVGASRLPFCRRISCMLQFLTPKNQLVRIHTRKKKSYNSNISIFAKLSGTFNLGFGWFFEPAGVLWEVVSWWCARFLTNQKINDL